MILLILINFEFGPTGSFECEYRHRSKNCEGRPGLSAEPETSAQKHSLPLRTQRSQWEKRAVDLQDLFSSSNC